MSTVISNLLKKTYDNLILLLDLIHSISSPEQIKRNIVMNLSIKKNKWEEFNQVFHNLGKEYSMVFKSRRGGTDENKNILFYKVITNILEYAELGRYINRNIYIIVYEQLEKIFTDINELHILINTNINELKNLISEHQLEELKVNFINKDLADLHSRIKTQSLETLDISNYEEFNNLYKYIGEWDNSTNSIENFTNKDQLIRELSDLNKHLFVLHCSEPYNVEYIKSNSKFIWNYNSDLYKTTKDWITNLVEVEAHEKLIGDSQVADNCSTIIEQMGNIDDIITKIHELKLLPQYSLNDFHYDQYLLESCQPDSNEGEKHVIIQEQAIGICNLHEIIDFDHDVNHSGRSPLWFTNRNLNKELLKLLCSSSVGEYSVHGQEEHSNYWKFRGKKLFISPCKSIYDNFFSLDNNGKSIQQTGDISNHISSDNYKNITKYKWVRGNKAAKFITELKKNTDLKNQNSNIVVDCGGGLGLKQQNLSNILGNNNYRVSILSDIMDSSSASCPTEYLPFGRKDEYYTFIKPYFHFRNSKSYNSSIFIRIQRIPHWSGQVSVNTLPIKVGLRTDFIYCRLSGSENDRQLQLNECWKLEYDLQKFIVNNFHISNPHEEIFNGERFGNETDLTGKIKVRMFPYTFFIIENEKHGVPDLPELVKYIDSVQTKLNFVVLEEHIKNNNDHSNEERSLFNMNRLRNIAINILNEGGRGYLGTLYNNPGISDQDKNSYTDNQCQIFIRLFILLLKHIGDFSRIVDTIICKRESNLLTCDTFAQALTFRSNVNHFGRIKGGICFLSNDLPSMVGGRPMNESYTNNYYVDLENTEEKISMNKFLEIVNLDNACFLHYYKSPNFQNYKITDNKYIYVPQKIIGVTDQTTICQYYVSENTDALHGCLGIPFIESWFKNLENENIDINIKKYFSQYFHIILTLTKFLNENENGVEINYEEFLTDDIMYGLNKNVIEDIHYNLYNFCEKDNDSSPDSIIMDILLKLIYQISNLSMKTDEYINSLKTRSDNEHISVMYIIIIILLSIYKYKKIFSGEVTTDYESSVTCDQESNLYIGPGNITQNIDTIYKSDESNNHLLDFIGEDNDLLNDDEKQFLNSLMESDDDDLKKYTIFFETHGGGKEDNKNLNKIINSLIRGKLSGIGFNIMLINDIYHTLVKHGIEPETLLYYNILRSNILFCHSKDILTTINIDNESNKNLILALKNETLLFENDYDSRSHNIDINTYFDENPNLYNQGEILNLTKKRYKSSIKELNSRRLLSILYKTSFNKDADYKYKNIYNIIHFLIGYCYQRSIEFNIRKVSHYYTILMDIEEDKNYFTDNSKNIASIILNYEISSKSGSLQSIPNITIPIETPSIKSNSSLIEATAGYKVKKNTMRKRRIKRNTIKMKKKKKKYTKKKSK